MPLRSMGAAVATPTNARRAVRLSRGLDPCIDLFARMMDGPADPGNGKNVSASLSSPRNAHAPARTSRLFAYRVAAGAEIAGRIAVDRVAGARAGRVGHRAADGAHGDFTAAGPADAARPSELELARIRHAGRLLAAQAHDGRTEDFADRHAQRAGVRHLSAGRAGLRRRRLGA